MNAPCSSSPLEALSPGLGRPVTAAIRAIATLALAALLACGCTRSPESLCEHVTKLVERQFGPTDPKDPSGSHDRGVAHCTELWAEKRRQDAKAYECYASCADRTKNVVDLAECKPRCYPREAPPRDEPENLQGWFQGVDASAPATATAPDARVDAPRGE